MGIALRLASGPRVADRVLRLHQRPLLLALLLQFRPLAASAALAVVLAGLVAHLHALDGGLVLVHGAQGPTDTQEEGHKVALGELGVVDEVGVDHVLQVAPSVVGEEDVDRLGGLVAATLGGDAVVKGGDDGGDVGEEAVGVDLAHGLLDGLGAEGAADLLEGEETVGRGVLDEVDVGEAALAEELEDLEAAPVDLERRRAGEAVEAVAQRVDQVEDDLRHGGGGGRVCLGHLGWMVGVASVVGVFLGRRILCFATTGNPGNERAETGELGSGSSHGQKDR